MKGGETVFSWPGGCRLKSSKLTPAGEKSYQSDAVVDRQVGLHIIMRLAAPCRSGCKIPTGAQGVIMHVGIGPGIGILIPILISN